MSVVKVEPSQRGALEALVGPPGERGVARVSGMGLAMDRIGLWRAHRTGECTVCGKAVATATGADLVL